MVVLIKLEHELFFTLFEYTSKDLARLALYMQNMLN
jgi:hypothetical protein